MYSVSSDSLGKLSQLNFLVDCVLFINNGKEHRASFAITQFCLEIHAYCVWEVQNITDGNKNSDSQV